MTTEKTIQKQPQPVRNNAIAASALRVLILAIGVVGAHGLAHELSVYSTVLIPVGGAVVEAVIQGFHVLLTREQVTPNSSPRANDGTRLVRIDSLISGAVSTVESAVKDVEPLVVQAEPLVDELEDAAAPAEATPAADPTTVEPVPAPTV